MKNTLFLFLSLAMATTLKAQLSGSYSINSDVSQNPDFTSFEAATSALLAGISGPVVFEVAPGTYEEFVTLSNINGTSESNRVVFKGMGSEQTVLTSNAGFTSNSTLTIDGADYVTFENMTITTTSENNAIVVTLRGGLTGDLFQNVRFVGCVSLTSQTDNDKNLVYRVSGGWMDTDNAFIGCTFINGFIGLYYQGADMSQYNDGLLVENCFFSNQCSKSIYATFTDHVTLRGNNIENENDSKPDYNAIDVFRCRYGCLIENNMMNIYRPGQYSTVCKLRPVSGSAEEPVIVRNNMVNLHCNVTSSHCYAFDNDDSGHIYFAHNTGKCSGAGASGNINVMKDWEHLFIYNNLFVNETDGYVFRFQKDSDNRYCDFNRVSYTGPNIGVFNGIDCTTLADWTSTTSFDAHSATCTPTFVGENDLHITSSNSLTVTYYLDYAPTDIDGENRPETPCAGADEFSAVSINEHHSPLSVYPNPTNNLLILNVADVQHYEYMVYDVLGRTLLRGQSMDQETHLDLGRLNCGIYFVTVRHEGHQWTSKVQVKK